jgi:phage shock protein A
MEKLMADSLQDRVARLVMGGAHALIDKVEGLAPEAVMAQAIRELDEVLGEVRLELGRIEATKHQLATRLAKLAGEHEDLGEKAGLALRENREDLARACIERQTLIEDQLPVLEQSLITQRERGNECEGYMRALMARKQEREQLLNEFIQSRQAATAPESPAAPRRQEHRAERAESAFDRAMARATGVVGYAGDQGDAMKLKEIADLQRRTRIDERLGALRRQNTEKP